MGSEGAGTGSKENTFQPQKASELPRNLRFTARHAHTPPSALPVPSWDRQRPRGTETREGKKLTGGHTRAEATTYTPSLSSPPPGLCPSPCATQQTTWELRRVGRETSESPEELVSPFLGLYYAHKSPAGSGHTREY